MSKHLQPCSAILQLVGVLSKQYRCYSDITCTRFHPPSKISLKKENERLFPLTLLRAFFYLSHLSILFPAAEGKRREEMRKSQGVEVGSASLREKNELKEDGSVMHVASDKANI